MRQETTDAAIFDAGRGTPDAAPLPRCFNTKGTKEHKETRRDFRCGKGAPPLLQGRAFHYGIVELWKWTLRYYGIGRTPAISFPSFPCLPWFAFVLEPSPNALRTQ